MITSKYSQIVMILICSGLLLAGLMMFLCRPSQAAFTSGGEYFVKPGASGACTQNQPCSLQTALGLAQNGDTIYVAQGTYTGLGDEVISVSKSITLAGGWDGVDSGEVVRDPSLYPSILDGERARRVVYIYEDITPVVDGFTITRGDATRIKISGCPSDADGCGGGIYCAYAHPVIQNNTITDNVGASDSDFSTRKTGYGGGIFTYNAEDAIVRNNTIISNAGSTAYWGSGGGIFFWGPNHGGLQVLSNQVLSNSATTQASVGNGGGIYGAPDDSLFTDNIFRGNRASQNPTAGGGAAFFQYGGNAHIVNNLMLENYGGSVVQLHYSAATFEGNKILDNSAVTGIMALNRSGVCLTPGCPVLENNVVAQSGQNGIFLGYASASQLFTATLINNTFIGSNTGYGIKIDEYTHVLMTNTIVVSYSWGITNMNTVSSGILGDHNLFWGNTYNGLQGDNPVFGDPAFFTGDYHLSSASTAIDAGIDAGLATDIDGNPRPLGMGVDIGADEALPSIYLPVILRN